MLVVKRDNDMKDIKHDFNDAESTKSTAATARELIRQSGLHRFCFENYNPDEFAFAHSIIKKILIFWKNLIMMDLLLQKN